MPQLTEVSERVSAQTGFTFDPAPGLVPIMQFYGSLADRVFHSTQYLRHPSEPLYTPEPDLVHEVIGHGVALAAPPFAELHRLTGEAARRLETRPALDFLAKVFWFTCEFGVIVEDGELRCYGAGLLSSYGEIDEFRTADVRPLDFLEMGTAEYDITHYQPILYRAESLDHLMDAVGGFFAGFDDDTPPGYSATPTSTGSGCSSTPKRSRTPSRTSRASASSSSVVAPPRLVRASVCLEEIAARPCACPRSNPARPISQAALVLTRPSASGQPGAPWAPSAANASGSRIGLVKKEPALTESGSSGATTMPLPRRSSSTAARTSAQRGALADRPTSSA